LDTRTSNTVDITSTVGLFHLMTARHVKCLRKLRWQGMWHVWGKKMGRLGVVDKFEGQRPYRRPRHRRDYNIKMDLKEIVWENLDGTAVAQDRDKWWALVNLVMNWRGP
jgi:hypothetical protein